MTKGQNAGSVSGQKKTLKWSVDLPSLFTEIETSTEAPGIVVGLSVARNVLHQLARRAIELNDQVLLDDLIRIGVISKEPEGVEGDAR